MFHHFKLLLFAFLISLAGGGLAVRAQQNSSSAVSTKTTCANRVCLESSYYGTVVSIPDQYESAPAIIKDEGLYKMWWCGSGNGYLGRGDNIFYATSSDGYHWSKRQNVLQPTGGEEGRHVCDPSVVKVDGRYYLYYTSDSADLPDHNNSIFLATSADGINWHKYPANDNPQPVIRCENADGGYCIGQSSVLYQNNKFYHYFSNTSGLSGNDWYVYLSSSDDGIHFRPENQGRSVFGGAYGQNSVDVKYNASLGLYFMIYGETLDDRISWNVSLDGINWLRHDDNRRIEVENECNHNPGILGSPTGMMDNETIVYYGAGRKRAGGSSCWDRDIGSWDIDAALIRLSSAPTTLVAGLNKIRRVSSSVSAGNLLNAINNECGKENVINISSRLKGGFYGLVNNYGGANFLIGQNKDYFVTLNRPCNIATSLPTTPFNLESSFSYPEVCTSDKLNVSLSWDGVIDGVDYQVEIANGSDGFPGNVYYYDRQNPSLVIENLDCNKDYVWRVKASNSFGSRYSEINNFSFPRCPSNPDTGVDVANERFGIVPAVRGGDGQTITSSWHNYPSKNALADLDLNQNTQWVWGSLDLLTSNDMQMITSTWVYYTPDWRDVDGDGDTEEIIWTPLAKDAPGGNDIDFAPGTYFVTGITKEEGYPDREPELDDCDFVNNKGSHSAFEPTTGLVVRETLPPERWQWKGICGGFIYKEADFRQWVQSNRGKTYIVLSEPNGPHNSGPQDLMHHQYFARVYKLYYDKIKSWDPSAQLIFGMIAGHWGDAPFGRVWVKNAAQSYKNLFGIPVDTAGLALHDYVSAPNNCRAAKDAFNIFTGRIQELSATSAEMVSTGLITNGAIYLDQFGYVGQKAEFSDSAEMINAQMDLTRTMGKWLLDNAAFLNIQGWSWLPVYDNIDPSFVPLGRGTAEEPVLNPNTSPQSWSYCAAAHQNFTFYCSNQPWY